MLIASCATDIKFHSIQNGNLTHTYKSRDNLPTKSLSWSKDGVWLVLVPNNGISELISIREEDTKLLQTVTAVQNVNVCRFQTTTKKRIAMGTQNGIVAIYDLKGKTIVKQFKRAKSSIESIDFNTTDSHLAAACREGDILVYSVLANQLSSTLILPNSHSVSTLRFHKNRRNLLSAGSHEGSIAVWDITSGDVKWSSQAHGGPVTDVTFSPIKDNLLISLGTDRKFCFHDINTKKAVLEMPVERALTCVDIHKDSNSLIMGSLSGSLLTYDMRNMVEPVQVINAHKSKVVCVRFQPDNDKSGSNTRSLVDISEASNVKTPVVETSVHNASPFNFSGFCTPDAPSKTDVDPAQTTVDSFLDALGGLSVPNVSYGDSPSARASNKSNSLLKNCSIENAYQHLSNKKLHVHSNSPKSSTPKYAENALYVVQETTNRTEVSPIITSAPGDQGVDVNKLMPIIKECVHEFKDELREEVMEAVGQIRRQIMDVHWSLLREFVGVEENVNSLRDDLQTGDNDVNILEENASLRQQVSILQHQIRDMQMNGKH